MGFVCNLETLHQVARDYPNLTVKEFVNKMSEPLEGIWTKEDIDYLIEMEQLYRDYRTENRQYV